MTLKKWTWRIAGLVVFVAAAGIGTAFWQSGRNGSADQALPARERNLAVFDAACTIIEANYFDKSFLELPAWKQYRAHWRERAALEAPALLYANVLNNFARSFPDSHVAFTPPSPPPPKPKSGSTVPAGASAERIADNDRLLKLFFSGPGFSSPSIRRGSFFQNVVDEIVPGSPAERAGIAPGWLVIDTRKTMTDKGVAFSGRFLRFAPAEARQFELAGFGPHVSTWTERTAYLEAQAFTVDFPMEAVEPAADFETRRLPGGITYLRFDNFTPAWIGGGGVPRKAMDAIDGAGPGGLILDLRRNRGGRALEMDRIAGRLLGSGALLGYVRQADGAAVPYETLKPNERYRGPLVVLIGPSSMSAAELTAAAVQDHKRGTLIGRATSGSVAMGNSFALPDGGSLMVPVKDFLRIDKRRIDNAGVQPDIWVLPTLADVRAGRDPVMERALQEITSPM